eukprot:221031_1
MFALSDAWFIISEFMTYHEIATVSLINKEANAVINQTHVWEQQCSRFFDTNLDNLNKSNTDNRFKSYFHSLIDTYGHDSIKYYKRIIECWTQLTKWFKANLPQMLDTFNAPATHTQINEFKKYISTDTMLLSNNFSYLTP